VGLSELAVVAKFLFSPPSFPNKNAVISLRLEPYGVDESVSGNRCVSSCLPRYSLGPTSGFTRSGSIGSTCRVCMCNTVSSPARKRTALSNGTSIFIRVFSLQRRLGRQGCVCFYLSRITSERQIARLPDLRCRSVREAMVPGAIVEVGMYFIVVALSPPDDHRRTGPNSAM